MLVKEMFFDVKIFSYIFFYFLITNTSAGNKRKIIENLKNTRNLILILNKTLMGKLKMAIAR